MQRENRCIQRLATDEPLPVTSYLTVISMELVMRLPPLAGLVIAAITASAVPAVSAVAQHGGSGPNIPQVAQTAGIFTTLLAAVDKAGLTETLLGRGPFTLFAPTDEAFSRLPNGTVADLLKPENRDKLRTILTYHVIAGRVSAAQARNVTSAATVSGQSIRISTSNDQLRINDAVVRVADVPASNGVIHIIDRVLIPSETRGSAPSRGSSSALDLLNLAIQRGVPLFNNGQQEATVAIYEIATRALLALGTAVPADGQRALRTALGDTSGSVSDRAFTLRGGLDDARRALTGQMQTANSH